MGIWTMTQDDWMTLRAVALCEYDATRATGVSSSASAAAAWSAVRRDRAGRYLRAPRWDEQHVCNTGARRTYRSPLGRILGVTGEYGSHCARWPRTVCSMVAANDVRRTVLAHLEYEHVTRAARRRGGCVI